MERNKGFGKKHPPSSEKIRIIKSYKMGQSVESLSRIFGFHEMTIYRWLRESNKKPDFKRKNNPGSGRISKIDKKTGSKLLKIIKHPATKFGFETSLWNLQRVQAVLKKELKIKTSHVTIWNFFQKMDYTCKKVQKTYKEADENKQSDWMKKTVVDIKKMVKKHNAILYFEDESNVSLSPVMGTSWSPKREKISLKVTGKRGSVAAVSAISNDGRLLFSLHDSGKRFNSDDIIDFLDQMLSHHLRRHLVVVMDQAPCHTSKKVKEYIDSKKRLHVFYLPAYSPQFNPDEKVWNHLKNIELKGHLKNNTKDLKRLMRLKLNKISKSQKTTFAIFKRCDYAFLYEN